MSKQSAPLSTWLSPAMAITLITLAGGKLGFGPQTFRFMFRNAVFSGRPVGSLTRRGARAGDVFISCFAKSGTNWAMQIAQQIIWRGDSDYDRLHDHVPWPEAPGPFAVQLKKADRALRSPDDRLVIKTHLPSRSLPYSEDAAYVVVVRDPKEVCVSAFHFFRGVLQLHDYIDRDQWVELFLDGDFLGHMWAEHLAGYWAWRDRPNVLWMTFDEMKADHGRSIDRMAEVIGQPLSASEREAVLGRSTFGYMKDNEPKFSPPVLPIHGPDKRPTMVRRGQTGGSSELLNAATQARIDEFCHSRLEAFGCDFPYAEHFGSE